MDDGALGQVAQRCWGISPWRTSEATLTWAWTPCSRSICWSRDWIRWTQRSLPTSLILGFCEDQKCLWWSKLKGCCNWYERYISKHVEVIVEVNNSCAWQCGYCTKTRVWGNKGGQCLHKYMSSSAHVYESQKSRTILQKTAKQNWTSLSWLHRRRRRLRKCDDLPRTALTQWYKRNQATETPAPYSLN